MTNLNPQTADRTRAEEKLREQVRQEIWDERQAQASDKRQAQASDKRKGVLLYLIPTVLLACYLLWGFTVNGWPF